MDKIAGGEWAIRPLLYWLFRAREQGRHENNTVDHRRADDFPWGGILPFEESRHDVERKTMRTAPKSRIPLARCCHDQI